MTDSHQKSLLVTGLSMGLLHVLAGPDHLSALAALAVGTSWKAFTLGFRWGIGHSTGLIVVAIIFIALKGDLDLRKLGRYCDSVVGVFMVALGCYGVVGALRTYTEKRNKRDADLEAAQDAGSTSSSSTTSSVESHHGLLNTTYVGKANKPETSRSAIEMISEIDSEASSLSVDAQKQHSEVRTPNSAIILITEEDHHTAKQRNDDGPDDISPVHECNYCPFIDMHDPATQRIVSFSIGLLHGVAGPGGILGVLPAVEMRNWRSSFLYLGSFIIASTLSMGVFAALYGEATKRIGATAESVELGLSIFSAAMSIIVGTIWLVLSIMGKLDDFFH